MFVKKKVFREDCKKILQKSSKINKLYKDKMIEMKLYMIMKSLKPKNLLLYMPMGFEPDINTFIKNMRKKCNIIVPFMEGVSFKTVKYRLPLKEKRFSIKEPNNSFLRNKRVDIAIVPVLGVGENYRRVGFGKGMYDRFFANLDYRPIIIFVQIEKCFNKKAITNIHDIQSDFYVTPEKIYITRGKRYVDRDFYSRSRHNRRRSNRCINTKKIRSFQI